MTDTPDIIPTPQENKDSKSNVVVEQIKNYILRNNLSTGDKLPTETFLSNTFHVSRASVREAMKYLESLGIIESIQGKGRYLREFNYDQMLDSFSYNLKIHFKDFFEVVSVRQGLEFYFLPLAMRIMDRQDIDELEELVDEMEEKIKNRVSYNEIAEIHAYFHKTLYKRINNKLLNSLISMFVVFQKLQAKNNHSDEKFIKDHRDLVQCLKTKDEDRLKVNLNDHFKDFIS